MRIFVVHKRPYLCIICVLHCAGHRQQRGVPQSGVGGGPRARPRAADHAWRQVFFNIDIVLFWKTINHPTLEIKHPTGNLMRCTAGLCSTQLQQIKFRFKAHKCKSACWCAWAGSLMSVAREWRSRGSSTLTTACVSCMRWTVEPQVGNREEDKLHPASLARVHRELCCTATVVAASALEPPALQPHVNPPLYTADSRRPGDARTTQMRGQVSEECCRAGNVVTSRHLCPSAPLPLSSSRHCTSVLATLTANVGHQDK